MFENPDVQSRDEKISTAETAETAELFPGKDKNANHFMNRDSSFPFEPRALKPEDGRRGGRERRDLSLKATRPY
jgi:hypothetical protein